MSTQKTTFEDRLLDRLRDVVAANPRPPEPEPREARRRLWPVAAAGLATAGVAAALAVVIAGGTQAAYAIDSQRDGSITVHIASLRNAEGLQAALRERGIRAVVDYSARCKFIPAPPGATRPAAGAPPLPSQVEQAPGAGHKRHAMQTGIRVEVSKGANGIGGVTFTIDPSSIPPGQLVYITTHSGQMNGLSIKIGSKAPTPLCPPPVP